MSDLPPPSPSSPEPTPPTPVTPPTEPVAANVSPAAEPAAVSEDPKPANDEEKTLGLVMQLLPLSGLILMKIPFVGIIAPLVLWLIKKDKSPYLDAVGKEVINFQLNVGVATLVGLLMCVIPGLIVAVAGIVLVIIAAVKTQGGEFYRFPWIYRVLK